MIHLTDNSFKLPVHPERQLDFYYMSKKHLTTHIIIQILLLIVLIIADRVTKILASDNLSGNKDITIIENSIYLHYLENNGAAFGIFQNSLWLFYLFTIFILLILVVLFILITVRLNSYVFLENGSSGTATVKKMTFLKYILIILGAGAVGNLIDRIVTGYVIDFIYLKFIDFPVFNLADIYVTVSSVLIIVFFIFIYKEDNNFHIFRSGKRT